MTTAAVLPRHAWATDRRWVQTQAQAHQDLVMRLHPQAVREWVAGGFVWRVDGCVVGEVQMNPHRGTWFGWVAQPKQ